MWSNKLDIRVFHIRTVMPILAFSSLLCENKKKTVTKCYPHGNWTQASHSLWFWVQHFPFWANWAFAYKTEILASLYSHALLIPLKSSKSKYQVVHEQKFKDLLSSTCPLSSERIVLDLELEAMRGPGSIPTGGNILSLDFFHVVKPA